MIVSLIAFGNHTVRSLLVSSFFSFKKALILENNKKDKKLIDLLKNRKVPFSFLDKKNFSRYGFDKKNQGVIIYINSYIYHNLEQLLKKTPKRKKYFFLMLDRIEDPQNFGTIIRSSAAFNLDAIIIEDKNQVPVNNTVIKVSSGGVAHIPVCRVSSLKETIKKLKQKNFDIISAVCDPSATAYNKTSFSNSVCLILGNEHKGIRKELVILSNQLIYIPVNNNMNSLNVAVSNGILCSHIVEQLENLEC